MSWPILQVVLASLIAGMVAGWLMHRADFCVVASLRDLFLFRDTQMLRAQMLLVALSVILFAVLGISGLQAYPAIPFYGLPSGSNLIGGLLFGFGMVLAGGCVVGVLYRLGSGSRLALVAFVGLLLGSGAYAEIHSWWAPLAVSMRIGKSATLSALTGIPSEYWALPAAIAVAWLWYGFREHEQAAGPSGLRGDISLRHAALGLALCGGFSLLLVGMPLGVTTSYAKLAAVAESLVVPRHVASLEFFTRQSMAYTPPYSGVTLAGGGGPAWDAVSMIQYPLIFGILGGAWLSAWRLGEVRSRFSPPMLQVVTVLCGGFFMGLASRLTPGCNVWHLWGGLPMLALSSMLFLVGIVPGAWFGTLIIRKVILHTSLKEES